MGRISFIFLCSLIITLPVCAFACKGRVVRTESSGVISDGDAEHPNYARCEWLIDAGDDNRVVYLEFISLNTECSYDFLFIFDGDSYESPKLASLSGENIPEPILSTGGKMLIYLFSDRNYKREGFKVRYLIQDCPLNCSGNGHCIDHVCICDTRFAGKGCELEICPEDCGAHGNCDNATDNVRRCQCDPGYSGYLCNISLNDAIGSEHWYTVAPAGSGFDARSAHAGAFLPSTNCLYIFGGFTLNNILNDLVKFCFDENRWGNITQMDPWPDGRYEHAIMAYKNGFYMYGGVLDIGYSNELWYYNATSEVWRLCAENSTVQPLCLSGHTLTLVDDDLYLFGGKTENGSFWSDIYKISAEDPSNWTKVIPYGGKSSERRLVGHSTVYHKESRSLIVFGGYSHSEDQPRFGTHTKEIHAFHVDNKVWSHIQPEKPDGTPSQRSFHSALIMGNYMVVYGGNTHKHHDNELCYDYEMYLYHLGCHTWVRVSHLIRNYAEEQERRRPIGRVSHVAAAAYGNLMLVAGGFSGYVRGDFIAYKFPSYVAAPQAEASLDLDFCFNYTRVDYCGLNPECFFCNNISTTNTQGCIHRTQKHLCRPTTDNYRITPCPGICPSLRTCHECLSQGQGASLDEHSPEKWTYIQPCNWCVKNAKCQKRSDPEQTCKDPKDTESGMIGWWGGKSASLSQLSQCASEDFPAGLQAIKYRPLVNMGQPDEVKIIRETSEMEAFRLIYSKPSYSDKIRWTGYIHPLGATIRNPYPNASVIYTFKLRLENISALVYISRDDTVDGLEEIINARYTAKQSGLEFENRLGGNLGPIFPNVSRGSRYYFDVVGEHRYPQHSEKMSPGQSIYQIELDWNGIPVTGNSLSNFHTFTSEFLEPYSEGTCSKHYNCLGCMTDALCAWCDLDLTCVQRNVTEEGSICAVKDGDKMLVTDASTCPICADHVDCQSCAKDPLCEWVEEFVVCVRRGRVNTTQKVAISPEQCQPACHGRAPCSECLKMRECAWCENLHTCLPFSDYVSRHRHGQCTEWIDSEEAAKNPYMCRNCSAKTKCDTCLSTFSCGWCGNTVNPTTGVCTEGDYSGPYGNLTCSAIVNKVHRGVPINESADWSYNMCPDVEECLLGLARCHKDATCINTPTHYNCTCNRGFEGDGKDSCEKTCYYKCVHGECLDDLGEFYCDCNLGWTGVACSEDCLCNGHSMCESGPGQCDFCLNNTTGEHCEQCKTGHFGDPSKPDGCFECECNGHGDPERGVCRNETGACFCIDNTFGFECEECLDGYYGDPHDGGKCYLNCDHGMIVEDITRGSLGSHQGPGVSTWKAYCLWIMTVAEDLDLATRMIDPPNITVGIEDLAVECERDHVYVYDGIPEFVDSTGSGVLLGAYCGHFIREFHSVTARSGIVTIYFNADISGNYSSTRGFNASYFVSECEDSCLAVDNKHCVDRQCVCMPGYSGPHCTNRTCEEDCTYDEVTASCQCEANFGGTSYIISSFPWIPASTATSTSNSLVTPVGRYGHTIIHCSDSMMYMFGGRSLKYGLLNDIWLYNFDTHTWTEIRPITSDQPSGRYFHAGACVPVRKNFYIFGGLVQSRGGELEYEASKEMWKFAIDARKWTGPIQPAWIVGVAGHSMTLVEETKLVIIGGFSTTKYFSDTVYEFDANSYLTAWQTHKWDNITGAKPTGIYGHSAVYNEASKTIYIYGGHVYRQERLFISDRLFTYDVTNKSWNILQPEKNSKIEPRYFHSAVGFADYMVVIGGYTHHRNASSKLLIYKYKCNFWYTINFAGTAAGKVLTSLIAARAILYKNSMIITGGYNNTAHTGVYTLTLPEDLCTLNSDFNRCTLMYGCEARIIHHSNGENITLCTSNTGPSPESNFGKLMQINTGTKCNQEWHAQRDCESITECSECIAVYPQFKGAERSCTWCSKCIIGKCIPRHKDCESSDENSCKVFEREKGSALTFKPSELSCPVPSCSAATCDRCVERDCIWSQHFKRVLYSAGEIKRKQSFDPIFNWSCVLKSFKKSLAGYQVFVAPPGTCPAPCYVHTTCSDCLDARGGEGGSQECYWSETLSECMPPAYLSLRCLAGECGTVLQGGSQKCPLPCDIHKKCGDCRKAPGCGWCAFGGLNGLGVCMSGTRSGPKGPCEVNNVSYEDKALADHDSANFLRSKTAPSWAYATCPPEDECLNGHHSCNVNTQNCKDKLDGYICECKEGYIWNDEVEECMPVCHQGCIHGVCTLPDKCQCHFGFVGKNCSTECECNRHSSCHSVEKKNVCLECKNNTQGDFCQECKPLFVGNPTNGGKCVSCTEFCNNHTDICLYWAEYNRTYNAIQKLRERIPDTQSSEFRAEVGKLLAKGPEHERKTYCVDCKHHTYMSRCEKCERGYFRLTSMTKAEPCTKCMCNGHGEMCDQEGGQNCYCHNNTETKCSAEEKLKISCHEVQCAVCKEYFMGTPTDGHQCFRQMNVNREYCLDPNTQNNCMRSPAALDFGQTVFFAVQPKYVNVDIRVTIDVTEGGIDVYFSPRENTFTVDVDKLSGMHTVKLDSNEHIVSLEEQLELGTSSLVNKRRTVRSVVSNSTIIRDYTYVMNERRANDLNTFITVTNPNSILLIRNVQYRLVITLPCDLLDLRTSRFFMIFKSMGDGSQNKTYGSLYFRQDQPHIDLFVFFSVFFSCFFLFLAMCVLLWKTKQAFDARRSRQQRAREMLHMASRPFAKVLVLIEHTSPFNISPNFNLLRSVKNTARTPLLPSETSLQSSPVIVRHSFDIVPIAIEPTDDGVAGVVSVVFQLPGGANAPSQLCLGSALTKGYQLSHSAGKQRRLPNSSQC